MVVTFDRDDIVAALDELVDHLTAAKASSHIRIVGGAAIAIRFGRHATTTDIDALYRADPAVEEAARTIARKHGWPETWLNDKVKMWTSHFDDPDDWADFAVRDDVTISVAGAPLLLAMKLRSGRGRRDAADIDLLLDACGVTGVAEALALYESYYPEDAMADGARRQLIARFGGSD